MALGRIKRNRRNVRRAARLFPGKPRKVPVNVTVQRDFDGTYNSIACVRTHVVRNRVPDNKPCGRWAAGRTPQAAIAKALKSLSSTVALRGRVGLRGRRRTGARKGRR